ncbi:chorion class B protein PC10-like [Nymphalis io]|uniref:chorion class B protein PC10-like n=1 Tax=Inachis io TaxID=171585 RepID=UPI002167DD90|nr:chorion class B protein PC10-like [Nymphalis io]
MVAKIALFAYVCVIAVQTISAQCIGAYNGLGLNGWEAAGPWGPAAYAAGAPFAAPWASAPIVAPECGAFTPFVPSNGGGFTITSASPIAPTGVTVTSENAYEGPLAVSGVLPFLGAVALEGALPTLGAGTINYGCGNGNVGMLNEDFGYNALGPLAYNGFAGPLAYEAGLAGPGFGYNGIGYGGCGAYY